MDGPHLLAADTQADDILRYQGKPGCGGAVGIRFLGAEVGKCCRVMDVCVLDVRVQTLPIQSYPISGLQRLTSLSIAVDLS